jgi:hypothetical protein
MEMLEIAEKNLLDNKVELATYLINYENTIVHILILKLGMEM